MPQTSEYANAIIHLDPSREGEGCACPRSHPESAGWSGRCIRRTHERKPSNWPEVQMRDLQKTTKERCPTGSVSPALHSLATMRLSYRERFGATESSWTRGHVGNDRPDTFPAKAAAFGRAASSRRTTFLPVPSNAHSDDLPVKPAPGPGSLGTEANRGSASATGRRIMSSIATVANLS